MRAAVLLSVLFAASPLVQVVAPEVRVTKRLLFVVDASGSMEGQRFANACSGVLEIASQPIDEMEIGLIAFEDDHARWPGVPDPAPAEGASAPEGERQLPSGWARLPSKDAVDAASAWLAARPPRGGTQVIPALTAALTEPRRELTVVLVTDGQFYQEDDAEVLAAIERAQQARAARGWGRAVIVVYGVGDVHDVLKDVAKRGKGGYFRRMEAPVIPPQPALAVPTTQPPKAKGKQASQR
jgi:Mg-chelatase subunit ChlD